MIVYFTMAALTSLFALVGAVVAGKDIAKKDLALYSIITPIVALVGGLLWPLYLTTTIVYVLLEKNRK